jgi:hypothetical protein
MRVMVIVKGNSETEAGVLPTEEELRDMGNFNEELVKAGVMLAGEGLRPSSQGVRLTWASDGKPVRTDGPFAEAKELVAGYWVLQVRSMDEALEWIRRAPFRATAQVELRQIAEAEDFGEAFTPELREQEDRQRQEMAARDS